MVTVLIPQPLRTLTDGESVLTAEGHNIRAVVRDLSQRYPELAERLVNGSRIGRGISLAINGDVVSTGLITKVPEGAEIAIVPQIQRRLNGLVLCGQYCDRCSEAVEVIFASDRTDLSVAEEAGGWHRAEDLRER